MKLCEINECTGCMACYNVCNKKAIIKVYDKLGFCYPHVEKNLCVECGLCQKVCPVLHPINKQLPLSIYSGWSKNEDVRMNSSSGGAFTEIAKIILSQNGVVFGCILDKNFVAIHSYVENVEELSKLQRSKYVQSDIKDSYIKAKQFLIDGRKVLFSGTPCQIAGLLSFLKKSYKNLYTIDLICHGVPSPKLWEDYKKYIEHKLNFKIQEILFRQKTISWFFFRMLIKGVDSNGLLKTYEGTYFKDRWLRVFLSDYFLRENCYSCKYCTPERIADFTLADWWSYRKENEEDNGYKKKGVSLIFVNTEKAKTLGWENEMKLRKRTLDEGIDTNKSLRKSWEKPINFNYFRALYHKADFETISNEIINELDIPLEKKILDVVPDNTVLSFLLKFTRVKSKLFRVIKKIKL